MLLFSRRKPPSPLPLTAQSSSRSAGGPVCPPPPPPDPAGHPRSRPAPMGASPGWGPLGRRSRGWVQSSPLPAVPRSPSAPVQSPAVTSRGVGRASPTAEGSLVPTETSGDGDTIQHWDPAEGPRWDVPTDPRPTQRRVRAAPVMMLFQNTLVSGQKRKKKEKNPKVFFFFPFSVVISASKLPESGSGPPSTSDGCVVPSRPAEATGQASPAWGAIAPQPCLPPRPPARMVLRAVVLAMHACLLATLRPSDPNVCSYWESFTAAVKESYTKPHVVSSTEPCPRALGSPLPCLQQRIVYRTEYRQAVRTDYRRRYQCCLGYYESRDTCVPRCTQECVHGRCVAPDLCQCELGWRGTNCSSECDEQSWGPGCGHHCNCHHGAPCDPLSGVCSCPPGFADPLCHQPCPPGTYGQGCRLSCPCHHRAPCNASTGACLCPPGLAGPLCEVHCPEGMPCSNPCPCQNGGICHPASTGTCVCPHGWMGEICSVPCPPGRFGPGCQGECRCHNGGHCDPQGGQCQCAPGFTGEQCRERCPVGRYGQDCQETCDCANGGQCFHVDGGCLCEAGFQGSRCEERLCLPGLYGLHCQSRCLCHPQHSQSCHPLLGECVCHPGWAGLFCNESCPPGSFGAGCLQTCLCLHGGTCDGTTGRCHCPPGYTDEHCSSLCPPDTFGMNCSGRCSCQHALACSPLDGSCLCKEGWHGPDCSMPCPAGTWGPSCNRSCECAHGAACDPQSGTCSCPPGWQGPHCLQPCPNGTFGASCGQRCDCAHADGCDPVTGECRCLPGWTGPQCKQGCLHGFWGRGCLMPCSCHNGAACSPQDGSCTCTPGYRGPTCQRPCPPGRYGKRCSLSCSCANGSSCHPTNGSCLCAPGWHGPRCSQPCPLGTFGLQCNQLCHCPPNVTCHPASGMCSCAPGRIGPHCEAGTPEQPYTIVPAPPTGYSSLGVVLSLVALVALLVAVVAVALCYRHRQKGKESRHLAVAYTAGQTDTSDYVVPDVPASHHAHYYSNPSYHTLSQCTLPAPGPGVQDRASSFKVPSTQLFPSVERPYGPEGNATLPPDWKHLGAPALGPRGGQLDRSYSYSCSLGKYNSKDHSPDGLGASTSSLASENPYATIKELPPATAKAPEGSYMEMKSPVRREMSYAEIGLLEEPSQEESCPGGAEGVTPADPSSHYDSPKNSHIPSHYDVPPARHYPPSPPLRRKDR
ncbi:platelet endothelial aggregation receptor 1 isoform X4 [Haliaeetus albicilla]|uniref:platelet endothelial aggregation receptor 1 isoform X4 n=1 Tax=Haliaeetus albicilla TaxID=8969 RepID=UPI0037E8007E